MIRSLSSSPLRCFTRLRADNLLTSGFVILKVLHKASHRQCVSRLDQLDHSALLSRFHAHCRSSFQLHNRQSRLLGGSAVKSLQSHFILTMSHWSSGLPVCFPSWGTQVQTPGGVLMWNRDSPVSVVSLSFFGSMGVQLPQPALSTLALAITILCTLTVHSHPPNFSRGDGGCVNTQLLGPGRYVLFTAWEG